METDSHEDVIRQAIEAWNENDWEAMQAINTPDVEVIAPEGWPESGDFNGWEAVRTQYERLKDSWSEEHIEIEELRRRGDAVFARFAWTGHGKASGIDLDMEMFLIYEFRGELIARQRFFMEEGKAEEAWKE